jgi:hypothetical protein
MLLLNVYPISVMIKIYNTFHGAKQVVNGKSFRYPFWPAVSLSLGRQDNSLWVHPDPVTPHKKYLLRLLQHLTSEVTAVFFLMDIIHILFQLLH